MAVAGIALCGCDSNDSASDSRYARYNYYDARSNADRDTALVILRASAEGRELHRSHPDGEFAAETSFENGVDSDGGSFCPGQASVYFDPNGTPDLSEPDELSRWHVDVVASRVERLKTITEALAEPTPAYGSDDDREKPCMNGKWPVSFDAYEVPPDDSEDPN